MALTREKFGNDKKTENEIENLMSMKRGHLRSRLVGGIVKPLSVDHREHRIPFSQSKYRISCTVMKKEQLRAKSTLKT